MSEDITQADADYIVSNDLRETILTKVSKGIIRKDILVKMVLKVYREQYRRRTIADYVEQMVTRGLIVKNHRPGVQSAHLYISVRGKEALKLAKEILSR